MSSDIQIPNLTMEDEAKIRRVCDMLIQMDATEKKYQTQMHTLKHKLKLCENSLMTFLSSSLDVHQKEKHHHSFVFDDNVFFLNLQYTTNINQWKVKITTDYPKKIKPESLPIEPREVALQWIYYKEEIRQKTRRHNEFRTQYKDFLSSNLDRETGHVWSDQCFTDAYKLLQQTNPTNLSVDVHLKIPPNENTQHMKLCCVKNKAVGASNDTYSFQLKKISRGKKRKRDNNETLASENINSITTIHINDINPQNLQNNIQSFKTHIEHMKQNRQQKEKERREWIREKKRRTHENQLF